MHTTYDADALWLSQSVRDRFIGALLERYPKKSFGYFLSHGDPTTASDFVMFEGNIRNGPEWRGTFESYGQYFVEHVDAGFVATPEESWVMQRYISEHELIEVAVFHTHLRHPATFSCIDYDLHVQRFVNLPHVIVSLRNPAHPQLRAFTVSSVGAREIDVPIRGEPTPTVATTTGRPRTARADSLAVSKAEDILALDSSGRPRCLDARTILGAVEDLARLDDSESFQEFVVDKFLRDAPRRYAEWVRPHMEAIPRTRFAMGRTERVSSYFQGESPRHVVELTPFSICRLLVTNALFGLLDQRRLDTSVRDRRRPVTDVSWFDASLFALWVGCALPTEAQWEFACGAGTEEEWCCEVESELHRYAWYSENARGEVKAVGTREPNTLGLFDLHGNVWEWCRDDYDQEYFRRSPVVDPLNGDPGRCTEHGSAGHKVARGGSTHALAEMCRTSFRSHEPAAFFAADQGFRLARRDPQAPT